MGFKKIGEIEFPMPGGHVCIHLMIREPSRFI